MAENESPAEPTIDEQLAELRRQTWEAELQVERLRIREPYIDALERAAKAEARAAYLESRVVELAAAAGRRARLREAGESGLTSVDRNELRRIADETLRDPEAMREVHEAAFERRQKARAERLEETAQRKAQR